MLPDLKNHKLKTVAKHLGLPAFKHHDAREDALACANIFLKLSGQTPKIKKPGPEREECEFIELAKGILADNEVNYKEAYELLYWLEDHPKTARQHHKIYEKTKEFLSDDHLDQFEASQIKHFLEEVL